MDELLTSIDVPRALPDALRARIERAMVLKDEPKEEAEPVPELMALDAPREIPSDLGTTVGSRMRQDALLEGLDSPRALPEHVRASLQQTLSSSNTRRARIMRVIAVAASLLLITSSIVAVVRSGARRPTVAPIAQGPVADTLVPLPTQRPAPRVAFDLLPVPAFPGVLVPLPPAATTGSVATPPVHVGIVGGDTSQEAGFRAYARALGNRLALDPISASTDARDAIATVNLSGSMIATPGGAPSWTRGPLLETLAVTEDVLHGDVFDFASAAERQAHIIADQVFPANAQGATAVIYTASGGIFSNRIPDAIDEVLRARNVTSVRVTYDPTQPPVAVPADAAFLSMNTAASRAWLRSSNASMYARGVAGIYTLLDQSLLDVLPDSALIATPYSLPVSSTEADAIARLTGRALDAGVIHGWVTAKLLALAIARSDARSSQSLARALRALTGTQSGFAPPYALRAGTNSRTPEASIYGVKNKKYAAVSGFRTDAR